MRLDDTSVRYTQVENVTESAVLTAASSVEAYARRLAGLALSSHKD
ncbi:hypothetical protein [Streptomyces niveus]